MHAPRYAGTPGRNATTARPVAPTARAARDNGSLRYFHVYICCLLTLACPIDKLHYALPFVYLATMFFTNRGHVLIRLAAVVGAVLGITALALLIDCFRGYTVNPAGVGVALICYAFLFIALAERFDVRMSENDFRKIVDLTAWFVIVESGLGFIQFVLSGGKSDSVAGTFGILDFTQPAFTFGQVFFSLCISAMVLFLMIDYRRPLVAVAIAMGATAFVLSMAGHQIVMLLLSGTIVVSVQYRSVKSVVLTGLLVGTMMILVLSLYPDTITQGVGWYRKTVREAKSPKRMVLKNSLELATDVKTLLIGTGMGQFTSRGALITTGSYLTVHLPKILVGKSDYYVAYVEPPNHVFDRIGEGSAISKPYFSLLTIPVEFGLLQTMLFVVIMGGHMRRNRRLSRSRLRPVAAIGVLANVGLLYVLLLCAVENYVEFYQALLVPFLLYVVAVSRAIAMEERG